MSEVGNAFSQFRAADYRKLARQNLFGFEESACGEKKRSVAWRAVRQSLRCVISMG